MARDYGDVFDIRNMTDDELYQLIVQELQEYPNVDADWVDVAVKDGFVTLSGRVGTAGEVQVAEKVLTDVIGVESYANELVVDELHRSQRPEAADAAAMQDAAIQDQLGEGAEDQSDTANHLTEDLEAQSFGTHDMQKAIEGGVPYIPPERPISEGYRSGENH